MTAAQLAQVIPCASATTFSTCAEAERLTSIPNRITAASFRIRFFLYLQRINFPSHGLPVSEPKNNPRSDHRQIQDQAHSQDRFDAPGAQERRAPLHDQDLIDERPHRQGQKHRLEPFQPEQTTGAQQPEKTKSCQDLREHSSTRREQGGNHREQPGALGVYRHRGQHFLSTPNYRSGLGAVSRIARGGRSASVPLAPRGRRDGGATLRDSVCGRALRTPPPLPDAAGAAAVAASLPGRWP